MSNQDNQFSIWLIKSSSQHNQPFLTTENMLKSPYLNLIKSIHLQGVSKRRTQFEIPNMDHIIIMY